MALEHASRINERLLAYWRAIKPAAGLPLEAQMEPDQLADIWDSCFLVSVHPDADTPYEYLMLGKALVEAYGDDLSGKTVCEALLYPHPKPLLQAFDSVVQTREPLVEDNHFMNPAGLLIKYRSCLLPLTKAEGGGVDYIFGGMKWKAY